MCNDVQVMMHDGTSCRACCWIRDHQLLFDGNTAFLMLPTQTIYFKTYQNPKATNMPILYWDEAAPAYKHLQQTPIRPCHANVALL